MANTSFFKAWSPEMAYILGFFFADGSLDINARGGHYASIQICDKVLLEDMRAAMGSAHKISTRVGKGNEKDRCRIQIGSKELCHDLETMGVSTHKTHHMCMPTIPRQHFGHFVRGYFDGDGNVWCGVIHKNRKTDMYAILTVFTSCSRKFLEGLRTELKKCGLSPGSFYKRKNTYKLQYSIRDSVTDHPFPAAYRGFPV